VSATWDATVLTLSQGGSTARGYLSIGVTRGGAIEATIPLWYFAPGNTQGQYALRKIVFNSAGSIIEDRYYLSASTGGVSELRPPAGATFRAIYEELDLNANTDKWVISSGATFNATQAISLGFANFPSGTVVFGALLVNNYAGKGDIAYATVTLP
jgi:hypothetical protein